MQRRSRYEAAAPPVSAAASVLSAAAQLVSSPAPPAPPAPLDVAYARLQPSPATSAVAFATLGYRDGSLHVWRVGSELRECAAIHPARPAFPRIVHVAAHPAAAGDGDGDAFASHRPLLLVAGFPDETGHSSVLALSAATGEGVHALRFAAAVCGVHSSAAVVVVACAHALYCFCARTMRLRFKLPCAPHPWGDGTGTLALGPSTLAWSPAVDASLYDPGAVPQPLVDVAAAAAATGGEAGTSRLNGSVEARAYVRPGHGTRVVVDSSPPSGASEGGVSPQTLAAAAGGDPPSAQTSDAPPDADSWRGPTLSAAKAVAAGVSHLADAAIESVVHLLGADAASSAQSRLRRASATWVSSGPSSSTPLLLPGFVCVASVDSLASEYADFTASLAAAAAADKSEGIPAPPPLAAAVPADSRPPRQPRTSASASSASVSHRHAPPLPHQQDRPGSSSLVFLHSGLQWRARGAAVAALAWAPDESLLAVADTEGQDVAVFRPLPGPVGESGERLPALQRVAVVALLSRGVRLARLTRLSFSAGAEWLCGTSDHGTTHVWHCGGGDERPAGGSAAAAASAAPVEAAAKVHHRPALTAGRVQHELGVAAALSAAAASSGDTSAGGSGSGGAFAEGGLVGAVVEQLRQWHLQVVVRAGGAMPEAADASGAIASARHGGRQSSARAPRHVLTVPATYDALFVGSRLACLTWDGRLHLYDLAQDATYCRLEQRPPLVPLLSDDDDAQPSAWQHVSAEEAAAAAAAPESARRPAAEGGNAVPSAPGAGGGEAAALADADGSALASLGRGLSRVGDGVAGLAQRTATAALRSVAGAIAQATTSASAAVASGLAAGGPGGQQQGQQLLRPLGLLPAGGGPSPAPVLHSRTLRIAFLAHAPLELPPAPPSSSEGRGQQPAPEAPPWRLRPPLVASAKALGTWTLRRLPHWPDICDRAALDGLIGGEAAVVPPPRQRPVRPPAEAAPAVAAASASAVVIAQPSTAGEVAAALPVQTDDLAAPGKPASTEGVAEASATAAARAPDELVAAPAPAPATSPPAVLPGQEESAAPAAGAAAPPPPADASPAVPLSSDGWLDFDIDLELPPAAAGPALLPPAEMALAMSTVLARKAPPPPADAGAAADTGRSAKLLPGLESTGAERLPLLLLAQFSAPPPPPADAGAGGASTTWVARAATASAEGAPASEGSDEWSAAVPRATSRPAPRAGKGKRGGK